MTTLTCAVCGEQIEPQHAYAHQCQPAFMDPPAGCTPAGSPDEWKERALKAEGALAKAQEALMELSKGLEQAGVMLEELKRVL